MSEIPFALLCHLVSEPSPFETPSSLTRLVKNPLYEKRIWGLIKGCVKRPIDAHPKRSEFPPFPADNHAFIDAVCKSRKVAYIGMTCIGLAVRYNGFLASAVSVDNINRKRRVIDCSLVKINKDGSASAFAESEYGSALIKFTDKKCDFMTKALMVLKTGESFYMDTETALYSNGEKEKSFKYRFETDKKWYEDRKNGIVDECDAVESRDEKDEKDQQKEIEEIDETEKGPDEPRESFTIFDFDLTFGKRDNHIFCQFLCFINDALTSKVKNA